MRPLLLAVPPIHFKRDGQGHEDSIALGQAGAKVLNTRAGFLQVLI